MTERNALIGSCTQAYGIDFSRLFEWFPQSIHVLARYEGVLVSHACWVTRWLQPEGIEPLRTAYVEAVATVPEHQRKGLGSAVMQRVAEEIRGRGYPLGGLSPAHASFYERLGWETWRGPKAIRTDSGLIAVPHAEVMILRTPSSPDLDLTSLLTAEWREGELW